jgi:hypothetical protein
MTMKKLLLTTFALATLALTPAKAEINWLDPTLPKCNNPEVLKTLEQLDREYNKKQLQGFFPPLPGTPPGNIDPRAELYNKMLQVMDAAKIEFSLEREDGTDGTKKFCSAVATSHDKSATATADVKYYFQRTEDGQLYVELISDIMTGVVNTTAESAPAKAPAHYYESFTCPYTDPSRCGCTQWKDTTHCYQYIVH